MEKSKRLGSDPFGWIKPTTEPEEQKTTVPQVESEKVIAPVEVKNKVGRPKTINRDITKASQEGLPTDWTRATFIMREDLLEKLKDYAYTDRRTIRDIVNEAIEQYLDGKEVLERRKK